MRERCRLPSWNQCIRYVVSYPRLSRITRRNGTSYLRFCVLEERLTFFRVLAARATLFFPAGLRREAPPVAADRLAGRADGRLDRVRLGVADRFASFVTLGTARLLPSGDRTDRCMSVNRIWSPNELYAQISATGMCRSVHRRFAVSMLEAGMYR